MKKLLLFLVIAIQFANAQQPRIYYIDYTETINSVSLSGDDDKVILTSFNSPTRISFYNDKLYVSDDNSVNRNYRFNPDGTAGKIIHDESQGAIKPSSVSGYNNELYFIDNNFIRKSDINGNNIVDILSLSSTPINGKIIVSDGKIYWNAGSALRVVNIDGTNESIVTDNGTFFDGFWVQGDEIFYIVDNIIKKSFPDGSNETTLLTPSSPNVSSPKDLTILDGKLYYTDTGLDSIMRCNLNGSNAETVYTIPGLANPLGIAGYNGFIYFTDSYVGARNVSRISTNLTNFEVILGDEFSRVSDLAIYNDELIFSDSYIKKSDLNGGMISTLSASNSSTVETKISETGEIYFSSDNAIMKTPIDSYTPQTVISLQIPGSNIGSFAISGDFIYWIENNNGPSNIFRAFIDGTNIENIHSDTVTLAKLEFYNNKLYWAKGFQQDILIQSNTDGSNLNTVLSANGSINNFELYNDLIYFGLSRPDNTKALATIEINGNVDSSNAQILRELPSSITDIQIYDPTSPSTDYDALVALYNSTNGDNWSTPWNLNFDISTFFGVTLDANGRVIEISMVNNNLEGALPVELGNLTHLKHLNLGTDDITGSIPSSLGNLSNLEYLRLSITELTGSIPNSLGNLSNLVELDLDSNELTGSIPTSISNLSNLQALSLSFNQLTGTIPTSLNNLSNLIELNLGSNDLTGTIPSELGSLTNLSELYLYNNELTGNIPTEIGNLTNLTTLSLNLNNLTGVIPSEMNSLTSLTFADIRNNEFVFLDIETIFAQYQTVSTFLYTPQNKFGIAQTIDVNAGNSILLNSLFTNAASTNNTYQWFKDDAEVAGATNLSLEIASATENDTGVYVLKVNNTFVTGLELESEPITLNINPSTDYDALVALYNSTDGANWTNTWDLSADISTFYGVTLDANGRVRALNLSNNNLIGTLPSELGNLSNLEVFRAFNNQLTGSIPNELGDLSNLSLLSLQQNQLTGNIPTELSNLSNLQALELDTNQLTGTIPNEFGNLSNLGTLQLSRNLLTGNIPVELGNLSNLIVLSLFENQLTGSIPNELGNLSNLITLQLLNNQLSGIIPIELGSLTNLHGLDLSFNQLTGVIPTELSNLSNLSTLNLYNNSLTGTIPTSLGNLSNLTVLDFTDNQLTGEIPNELGNLTNLTRIGLARNQLTGTIPVVIANLTQLTSLVLSTNNLTGTIPPELGNLANLETLFMHTNNLTGVIPSELGNISSLTGLSIRNNSLSGEIPSSIGNLTNLNILSIRSNNFTGPIPAEMSNLTNLTFADIRSNNFVFLDIEPVFAQYQTIPSFFYTPQNTFGTEETIEVETGNPISLNSLFADVSSNNNTYQWYKDDNPITGATNANLEIPVSTNEDAGVYVLKVNNTVITGLELESEPLTVNVTTTVAPNYLAVTDTTLFSDATGNVDIQLINSENIRGFQFDFTLPTGFTFNTADLITTDRITDYQTSISDLGNNTYRVLGFSFNPNTVVAPGDGAIITLPIFVEDTVTADQYIFEITNVTLSNPSNENIASAPLSVGVITVLDIPLGDSNGNGTVDVIDLLQTIDFILGNNPMPFVFTAADVNMDGVVNIQDIGGIQDIILNPNTLQGGNEENNEAIASVNSVMPMDNYLLVKDQIVIQDSSNTIEIELVNDDIIRGFQFDINLPTGFSLDIPNITAVGRLSGFIISSSDLGNNNYRVLAFSFTGGTIASGTDAILTLPITVAASVAVADYTLPITGVVLSDVNNIDIASTPLSVGTISVSSTLSVDNVNFNANNIKMYPNPASDFVNIAINNTYAGAVDFNLYDMAGKLIYTHQTEKTNNDFNQSINTSQLSNGVYMLNIKTNNSNTTKRLVISK